MAARNNAAVRPADPELFITRVFDAPRALVFAAWTKAEHLRHWLGPRGFTATSVEGDVRPGGAWRSCIRSPEAEDYWAHGVYREIVAPERLVFTYAWEDEGALETLVTVTFADEGGKTRLTFHQTPFSSVESRDGHAGGWNECFDRLGAYVATMSDAA